MNPNNMQEEDDGFGDFRAKVKGLPRDQRMAELKKMEDAVLENLRSNLADLYAEDQPAPGPAPMQPPMGEPPGHAANDMEPDDDMDDGAAPMRAPMMKGSIIDDGEDPAAFDDVATPTQFTGRTNDISPKDAERRGRIEYDKNGNITTPEDDPDLPYGAWPLPVGSMTGVPYPENPGGGLGGDGHISELYRWEKDNGAYQFEYDSPEYKKFVADYMAKLNGDGRGKGSGMAGMGAAASPRGMFGRPR